MEKEICKEVLVDLEQDPKVIELRTKLFNKYVVPYYNMIYKLCIKYSFSPKNVQENYIEVLANFYRFIPTYDTTRSIKTWLHIVTKRHILELEKKRGRKGILDNTYNLDNSKSEAATDNIPANAMQLENYREYYSDDVLQVLDMMKPIHKYSLLLQEVGYSLKEITQIEYEKGMLPSRNIETVKSRLFFAHKFLKKNLTRDGERKRN